MFNITQIKKIYGIDRSIKMTKEELNKRIIVVTSTVIGFGCECRDMRDYCMFRNIHPDINIDFQKEYANYHELK